MKTKRFLLSTCIAAFLSGTAIAPTDTPDTIQTWEIGRFLLIQHKDKTYTAYTEGKTSLNYKRAIQAIKQIQ